MITPLAPLDPYKAADVASFNTENEAMLSGSTRAKSFALTSNPSIRIRGLLAYPKVVTPRTKNCALSAPGSPLLW